MKVNYEVFHYNMNEQHPIFRFTEDTEVDRDDYEKVYEGSIELRMPCEENDILNAIFHLLNVAHPSDYKCRSLSMGDIVHLKADGYYLCCSIGWRKLPPGSKDLPE